VFAARDRGQNSRGVGKQDGKDENSFGQIYTELRRSTMKLVQFDFAFTGPFGDAMASALKELAEAIAQEPGLIWKIWTENEEAREAGGIYLFTDDGSARVYVAKHTARLNQFGISDVRVKIFDVNDKLTAITRGPTASAL